MVSEVKNILKLYIDKCYSVGKYLFTNMYVKEFQKWEAVVNLQMHLEYKSSKFQEVYLQETDTDLEVGRY